LTDINAEAAASAALRREIGSFRGPRTMSAIAQIGSSFGGFAAVVAGMYLALDLSWWLALAAAPLAAGFLVRIFIIQHDCGHGSFFRSRRANGVLGVVCSLITLTPFVAWRRQHAGHHGTWNDLDRRASGADIYSSCLTVAEYRALSSSRRALYRASRHPLVANLLLPPLIFLLLYRLPFDMPASWRRERRAVHLTNGMVGGLVVALGAGLGFAEVAAVQLSVMVVASIVGVWLFSVQHRFEGARWMRAPEWSSLSASLEGAAFLNLPGPLRWFTGNIGFHHVHHLDPRIPNYRLRACHDASPALRRVPGLTLTRALASWRLTLWDEDQGRMVGFTPRPLRSAFPLQRRTTP